MKDSPAEKLDKERIRECDMKGRHQMRGNYAEDAAQDTGYESHNQSLRSTFFCYIAFVGPDGPHCANLTDTVKDINDQSIVYDNKAGTEDNDDSDIKDKSKYIKIKSSVSGRRTPVDGFNRPVLGPESLVKGFDDMLDLFRVINPADKKVP